MMGHTPLPCLMHFWHHKQVTIFRNSSPQIFSGGLLLAMVGCGCFESFLNLNHEFTTPQSPIGRYTDGVNAKNVGPLLVGGG